MADTNSGGIVREIIVRFVDSTKGAADPVPKSGAAMVAEQTGANAVAKTQGAQPAEKAAQSNASVLANGALQVATPALNAVTDNAAGQVIGGAKQAAGLIKGISAGGSAALGAAVGVGAQALAQIVTYVVNRIQAEKQKNNSIAEDIDSINRARIMQGLSTIEYSKEGWLGKVVFSGK